MVIGCGHEFMLFFQDEKRCAGFINPTLRPFRFCDWADLCCPFRAKIGEYVKVVKIAKHSHVLKKEKKIYFHCPS